MRTGRRGLWNTEDISQAMNQEGLLVGGEEPAAEPGAVAQLWPPVVSHGGS